MSGFDPLVVKYGDVEKTIPGNQVLRVAAEVEQFIPYGSVSILLNPHHFNFALISSAYLVLLRWAGIPAEEKELLQRLSSGEVSADAASSILALFSQYEPVKPPKEEAKKKSRRKPSKKTSK